MRGCATSTTATSTATVVFTDIVGVEEHVARMGPIEAERHVADHQSQLRTLITARGGRVVKPAGCGVMAVFQAASDAVSAAVSVVQGVAAAAPWLQVRIGIAAGDVGWEGPECFGLPVVVAARLEAAASAGEIWVSAVVALMAGDRSPVSYQRLGLLALPGVPSPVEAYAVIWEPVTSGRTNWLFPTTLPEPALRPFVGRAAELRTLDSSWLAAVSGGRATVMLGGEAGSGKTRLISEFSRRRHDDGALVLIGVCDRELPLPYQPWVAVLDHLVRQLPESVLEDLREDLSHLSVLVPRVERVLAGLARPQLLDPDTERHRLFGAIRSVLAAGAALTPLLVVLDDVHWAGSQTLAVLRYLARTDPLERTLIVATFRDTGDEITDPLAATLADLRRVDGVTRIKLSGLDHHEVLQLLTASQNRPHEDLIEFSRVITERTGGNPFFVWELCADYESGAASGVPDSVREVVAARLQNLSEPARRVAEIVAVASTRVELAVLCEAAGATAGALEPALSELLRSGLVDELPGPVPSYQCAHALLRDAVAALLPTMTRARLHLDLACALERVHEADRRLVLAELTRHFAAAATVGGADKAIYYGQRAATQARRTAAYEEAISLLGVALEVVPAESRQRAGLLVDLVDLLQRSGRLVEATAAAEEAYRIASATGDVALQADAAIVAEKAAHLSHSQNARLRATEMVAEVLATVPRDEVVLRAKLGAALGRGMSLIGHVAAEDVVTVALTDARQAADAEAITMALEAATVSFHDPRRVLEITEELERLTVSNGDAWRSMWATGNRTRVLIELGELAEARTVLERHTERSKTFRFPLFRFQCEIFASTLAVTDGRFADAEAAIERAESIGSGSDSLPGSGIYGLQMFMIRREQGRLEEMRPVLNLLRSSETPTGIWGPGLALAFAELGMLEHARPAFERVATDDFANVARDSLWPVALGFLAEAAILLNEDRRAPVLERELNRFQGRMLAAGFSACAGSADRLSGAMAELRGHFQDADDRLAAALELTTRSGSPVWQARVEHTWAWALAHRGDRAGSSLHWARACDLAAAAGMGALPAVLSPKRADGFDGRLPDALSPREVEVLALVAAGRSNREIAHSLFISPNTAANHVRAILQKTGSSNRTEAATYALRNGIAPR